MLIDHYRMEYIDLGTFSVKRFKDNKGSYVNTTNLEFYARNYLLGAFLDGLDIPPDHKSQIRSVLATVSTVRNKLTPYSGPTPFTTWQLTWKPSSTLTLQFLEEGLYTGTFDGRYKDARKSSLEIADFMNYQSVADKVLEIKDAITNGKSGGEAGGASGDANVTAPAVVDPAAPMNQQTSLAVSFKQLSEQETWTKHMQKVLSGTIRLLVDDGTTARLKTAIQSIPLAMTKGDPTGLVLFIFGRTLLGQLRQIINMRVELQPKYRTEQQFETASSQHIKTTESIVANRINF